MMEVDDPMRYEYRRLETFKRFGWSGAAPITCEKLAKAGFYYAGNADEVICFACAGKHSGWKLTDKAFAVHSTRFPLCPFVRQDATCGNIALLNYKVPSAVVSKAGDVEFLHPLSDSSQSVKLVSAANDISLLPTVSSTSTSHAANSSASNSLTGFSGTESSPDSSFEGNLADAAAAPASSQDGMITDPDTSSDGMFVPLESSQDSSADMSFAVTTTVPASLPGLNHEQMRLRTFTSSWPIRIRRPTVESLAQFGFYYTGCDDTVQCAFCNGSLNHWAETDDAATEHRRHFPWCNFMNGIEVGNVPLLSGFKPSRENALQASGGSLSASAFPPNNSSEVHFLRYDDDAVDETDTPMLIANDEAAADSDEFEQAGRQAASLVRRTSSQSTTSSTRSESSFSGVPQLLSHFVTPNVARMSLLRHSRGVGSSSTSSRSLSRPTSEGLRSAHSFDVTEELLDLASEGSEVSLRPSSSIFEVPVPHAASFEFLEERHQMPTLGSQQTTTVNPDHDYLVVYSRRPESEERSAPIITREVGSIHDSDMDPFIRSLLDNTSSAIMGLDIDEQERLFRRQPTSSGLSTLTFTSSASCGISGVGGCSKASSQFESVIREHLTELNVFTDKPCRPDLATVAARLETFKTWPGNNVQRPPDMAEAGFYYIGEAYQDAAKDNVRCFHCGVLLHQWQPTDEAWVEHARHFPRCQFVLINRGQNFVKSVLAKFKATKVEMMEEEEEERPSFEIEEQSRSTVLVDPGVQNAAVKPPVEVPKLLAELSARGVCVSAEQIRQALDIEYPERLIVAAIVDNNYQLFRSLDDLISRMESLRFIMESESVQIPQSSNANTEAAASCSKSVSSTKLPGSDRLQDENRLLKEQRLCKICMDSDVSVVFLPCGHLISCAQCYPALTACPICRKKIAGIVRTYMS